jgi:hypothetical protein
MSSSPSPVNPRNAPGGTQCTSHQASATPYGDAVAKGSSIVVEIGVAYWEGPTGRFPCPASACAFPVLMRSSLQHHTRSRLGGPRQRRTGTPTWEGSETPSYSSGGKVRWLVLLPDTPLAACEAWGREQRRRAQMRRASAKEEEEEEERRRETTAGPLVR